MRNKLLNKIQHYKANEYFKDPCVKTMAFLVKIMEYFIHFQFDFVLLSEIQKYKFNFRFLANGNF